MMATAVRTQLMSSVGHLAQERQRLEAEIARLSSGLPDEAARIVEQADALMAEHGAKLAALKSRRDEIDRAFDVSEHARRQAEAEAHAAEVASARNALKGEVDGYLEAYTNVVTGLRQAA